MKNIVLSYTLAILASGAAFVCCQPADADTVTVKEVNQGPATVIDSWMQPTVVRTRAIKDADGTTSQTVQEPLIMERHERVVVPEVETTTTTSVNKQPTVVQTERQAISYKAATTTTAKPAKKRAVRRHYRRAKPHTVARRPVKKRSFVATKTVEQRVESPTVVERTEQTVQKERVIERRHPALDYN
ncbi:MAG: hypothetical protein SGJ27_26170 [Candidatus Melainabacteria bacterium]|nr:hypothetical protein [Candidatus Melainabacteria bacterium]